jgi:hypothetical protein
MGDQFATKFMTEFMTAAVHREDTQGMNKVVKKIVKYYAENPQDLKAVTTSLNAADDLATSLGLGKSNKGVKRKRTDTTGASIKNTMGKLQGAVSELKQLQPGAKLGKFDVATPETPGAPSTSHTSPDKDNIQH